jgi:hypothetical protein
MKKVTASLLALTFGLLLAVNANAQDSKYFKNGPVTQLTYVKVKPGKFDEYMGFIDTSYKSLMEANKKAGLILSYAVYQASPRSPQEPDLILSVTTANYAALDKDDEMDAVAAKVMGSTDAQSKGAADRESLREILGSEIIREMILK